MRTLLVAVIAAASGLATGVALPESAADSIRSGVGRAQLAFHDRLHPAPATEDLVIAAPSPTPLIVAAAPAVLASAPRPARHRRN